MKKILIILLTIPLIFSSCEKEDDTPDSNSNNPIGNTPTGTTGYLFDNHYNMLYKTTNSGNTWVEVTDIDSYFSFFGGDGTVSFVN